MAVPSACSPPASVLNSPTPARYDPAVMPAIVGDVRPDSASATPLDTFVARLDGVPVLFDGKSSRKLKSGVFAVVATPPKPPYFFASRKFPAASPPCQTFLMRSHQP